MGEKVTCVLRILLKTHCFRLQRGRCVVVNVSASVFTSPRPATFQINASARHYSQHSPPPLLRTTASLIFASSVVADIVFDPQAAFRRFSASDGEFVDLLAYLLTQPKCGADDERTNNRTNERANGWTAGWMNEWMAAARSPGQPTNSLTNCNCRRAEPSGWLAFVVGSSD